MLLKIEIEKLRDSFFTTCSEKEKLFYCYLAKQPYVETIEMPTGDLDKICYAVFTNSVTDVSKEVKRVALSEPFKHIHYSNSIITLIPVCLKSIDAKSKYLKNYFDTHSLAEKLLLKKVFPLENLHFITEPETELDKLIDYTFVNPQLSNALQHLSPAFLEVNDIVGLLAFRESYIELLKIHPNTEIENQFSELSDEINKLISVVSRRIDITINLISFFVFLIAFPSAVYVINKYYTQLEVEKLSNISTFVSPILYLLLFISKKLFPKFFSFYDDIKQWVTVSWFRFHRLDYYRLLVLSRKE